MKLTCLNCNKKFIETERDNHIWFFGHRPTCYNCEKTLNRTVVEMINLAVSYDSRYTRNWNDVLWLDLFVRKKWIAYEKKEFKKVNEYDSVLKGRHIKYQHDEEYSLDCANLMFEDYKENVISGDCSFNGEHSYQAGRSDLTIIDRKNDRIIAVAEIGSVRGDKFHEAFLNNAKPINCFYFFPYNGKGLEDCGKEHENKYYYILSALEEDCKKMFEMFGQRLIVKQINPLTEMKKKIKEDENE